MATHSVLFVLRHSPYESDMAKSSTDAALAFAAFEQPINLLFLGAGVLQLLPEQEAQALGRKSIYKQLLSLPLYDVDQIYVDEAAAQQYHVDLNRFSTATELVSGDTARALMCDHDHVLGF